jgi:hypothetical protein
METPSHYWRRGEQRQYRFRLATQARMDLGAITADEKTPNRVPSNSAPSNVGSVLEAILIASIVEVSPKNIQILARLDSIRLSLTGIQVTEKEKNALQAALRLPFCLMLSPQGKVQTITFRRESPTAMRQTIRTVCSAFQCVLAPTEKSVREDDVQGEIESLYLYQVTKNTVTKRVTRIITPPDQEQKQLPEGEVRYGFDAHGLHSVQGERKLRTLLVGKEVVRSAMQIHAERLKNSTSILKVEALPTPDDTPEKMFVAMSTKDRDHAINQSALGKKTLQELLNALNAAENTPNPQAEGQLFAQLRALFALQPESIQSFQPLLESAKPGSVTLRMLTLALSGAGTETAQTALVQALQSRRNDPAFVQSVLPNLVEQTVWTPSAETLLLSLCVQPDNTGKMATLLLGTAIHTLQASEPPRANRLLGILLTRLKASKTIEEKSLCLDALGNAGLAKALLEITSYLFDREPQVRRTATDALRLILNLETDQLLCRVLKEDKDASVRQQAAITLSFRLKSVLIRQALENAKSNDLDMGVRAAAKETLDR